MNFDNQVISIVSEERDDFDKAMSFFPKLDKLEGYLVTNV